MRVLDLYKNTPDNSCRFLLGKNGTRMLGICGINPSTADQQQSDTTLTKVIKFADLLGYRGFVMFNVYPLRAIHPNNLPNIRNDMVVQQNITHIIHIFERISQPTIWAAWGNTIAKRDYLKVCLQEIVDALHVYTPQWIHGGELTTLKHPRHPSRLPYWSKFQQFDIDSYVQSLVNMSQ
jgi:hypothetical protein